MQFEYLMILRLDLSLVEDTGAPPLKEELLLIAAWYKRNDEIERLLYKGAGILRNHNTLVSKDI